MKKENGINKRNGGVVLRSAAISGILSLAIGLAGTPVLNFRALPSDEIHSENANYSSQILSTERITAGAKAKINYNLPGIYSTSIYSYTRLGINISGKSLLAPALYINDIYYLPIRDVVLALVPGATVNYNQTAKTVTVSANGLNITVSHGAYVLYANDRPLFSFSPAAVMSNGKMYVTASSLTKALGLSFAVSSGEIMISGSYRPLTPASKFYREDEVYWLSKIISAEAAGESLLGQIAVGDVIMNRVKSNLFPSTIYGVIFDKKYGVQFSPTADGRIYANPTYTAVLAAKICLEGVSLSDDAMYFLNPRVAESNWIVKNRAYTYTIGNHDFYK